MSRLTIIGLMVCVGLSCALTTSAQPFEIIYSFGNAPANPRGNLTLGPDGNFYGTTASGGQYGEGAVFRVTTNGDLMTLVSFGSFLRDATWPFAGLTLGADGNFYGTTATGGTNQISGTNNTGTIFRVTTNGTLTPLVSFTGFNGSYPECELITGPNGNFYGTTAYGGISNVGTVFQVTTNGVLTTLASFSVTNGAMPQSGLVLGLDGNFYGTTTYGGISNVGTLFQMTPGGSLKTLVNFNTTNGAGPYGQLRLGSDGDLYGTTVSGGISTGPFQVTSNSSVGYFGTVFRVTTNGTLTTLADFTMHELYGGIYPGLEAEMGWNPYGQLIQGADGSLYGTTSGGGANGTGAIFKVSTNGTLDQLSSLPNLQYQFLTNFLGYVYVNYTTNNFTNSSLTLLLNASVKKLYDFPPLVNTTNSTGANSHSGLTLGPDGNFYAAVYQGGAGGYGTIIRIATNGAVTPLASFSGNTGSGIRAGLTLGPDGSLYGAAQLGGVNGIGTLFKRSRDGNIATLHSFNYRPDGANPNASLALGPDGNLYGTAINGGTNLLQTGPNSYSALSYGTIFRLTTNGIFTPITYFNSTNGANPYSALTLLDGNFYGTTAYGGISNLGTVFQVTTNGDLTTLDSFTGNNGSHPYGRLAIGPNGNLFGMTGYGGISNVGTLFEISTQGMINPILHFTGTNGANPQSGLFWNSDGYFYGITESGGSKKLGTVFKVTPGGALTTLASFGQTNGSFPSGELIKGPDGNLYGAAPQGGTGFNGTVFRLNAGGTLTTLFSFPSTPLNASFSSGYRPYSGLTLVTNGSSIRLYGTAFGGGNNGGGTIFRVNLITYYAVPENVSSLLNPLTNDMLWTTGGSLNLVGTSTTNGTAAINGTGIQVLPATNFTGSATLAYTFTDGSGQTNTSLIALLVTNIPPVANPDSATVAENSTLNPLSPLVNDLVQTPGGTLGLVSVSTTNGTAVISGTNVLFTPALNYVGPVTINYTVTDHIGGTNSSFIAVQVTNAPNSSADLSLSGSALVGVGGFIHYDLVVINLGPSAATDVIVSNQFPSYLDFRDASTGDAPTNGILLMHIGSLASGATNNINVNMGNGGITTNSFTNVFQVFGDEPDPDITNNIATIVTNLTTGVTYTTSTRQLETILTTNIVQHGTNFSTELIARMPNGTVVFDQTFSNAFSDPVLQTAIATAAGNLASAGASSYLGPTQTSFIQTSQGSSSILATNVLGTNISVVTTEYIGPTNIFVGENQSQLYVLTPGSVDFDTLVTLNVTNLLTATVTSNYLDSSVYVMTGVVATVDLRLSLTAAPDPVVVGDPLTYSLAVTNQSSTTAMSVTVSNTLPTGVTFNTALPSQGTFTNKNGVVILNLGTITASNNASAAIIVISTAAGFLTNRAVIASTEPDSEYTNNSARIVTSAVSMPITNLVAIVLSPMTLNPQTGLFEQKVQVSNGGPETPASVILMVSGLATNARLYNAAGTTNGLPFVQSTDPLPVGSNVVFLLEFYVPTRIMPTNLTYTVLAGGYAIPSDVTGVTLAIDRMTVLDNGSVLVEFTAIPGRSYAIQYSSDMIMWKTAVPAFVAPANRVQWIDAGPPKTDSNPAGQPKRFYQVILLPAN